MVASRDLSIVIQGPVSGTSREPNKYTKECLATSRKFFPDAEIVFSTWEGENISGLEYNQLVVSKAPKLEKCLYEDMTEHFLSINHLLLSSQKGLNVTTRPYVIKMRSDMAIKSNKCLEFIGKYTDYDQNSLQWKVFTQRLITLPQLNPNRVEQWFPYSICDWIQIGLREDVINLYDVPFVDIDGIPRRKGMKYIYADDYLGAEQYLFHSILEKNGLPVKLYSRREGEGDIYKKNSIAIAMNMVLLSARQLGVSSLKYPGRMYAIDPFFSLGYYTFGEWKELYNIYGGGSLKYTTNKLEQGVYKVFYSLRRKIRS